MENLNSTPDIKTFLFGENGDFPNNDALPVIVIPGVTTLDPAAEGMDADAYFKDVFHKNGWESAWAGGIYNYHHYHSTAHEVLGIAEGRVKVQFGGPNGKTVDVYKGDVILVPAGVAHKNTLQSSDLLVIGAYPKGQTPNMKHGFPGEKDKTRADIKNTPLPIACPVFGASGPILNTWKH